RVVVFGAFDRHNLGDLLFAHVAQALLDDRECLFAGIVERDLRAVGGHHVRALADVAREARDAGEALPLLHAGGEILTCDAWQAAVMLREPVEAARIVARLDAKPRERETWARQRLGKALRIDPADVPAAPYVVSASSMPGLAGVAFAPVGGVELASCSTALRDEVLEAIRGARTACVRDQVTLASLRAAGVDAALVPDPVVTIESLFGKRIRSRCARSPGLARVRSAFPAGWLATQFSADFGDDATVTTIAAQLDFVHRHTGLGVVLFRAGAAPWHDSLEVLERIAARMQAPALVLDTLDARDLCAVIAGSRGFCGSSLHGRIVASAFGLARVNVSHPSVCARTTKQHAWAATWECQAQPGVVPVQAIGEGVRAALSVDPSARERQAAVLAARCRDGFESIRTALGAR
ncbi:MAG TPA: polysaccharide pyruvyl transferase family protein, partial [Zeimonas sp.]